MEELSTSRLVDTPDVTRIAPTRRRHPQTGHQRHDIPKKASASQSWEVAKKINFTCGETKKYSKKKRFYFKKKIGRKKNFSGGEKKKKKFNCGETKKYSKKKKILFKKKNFVEKNHFSRWRKKKKNLIVAKQKNTQKKKKIYFKKKTCEKNPSQKPEFGGLLWNYSISHTLTTHYSLS